MPKLLNIIGKTFGRLQVINRTSNRRGKTHWQCQCECGNQKIAAQAELTKGETKSCGCLHKESSLINLKKIKGPNYKHHHAKKGISNPTYNSWRGMKDRCQRASHRWFHNYGGRGILICDRWNSFENFLMDMGERPPGKFELDRINPNGNYEPSNCRWYPAHKGSQRKLRSNN